MMLKRYLFLLIILNTAQIFSDFPGKCCIAKDDLKAAALVIRKNATILGNKKIGKDLNLGGRLVVGCPPRFAVGSKECNLANLGGVIGLSARLNLPQTVDPVEAIQFFNIPLFIEDPQVFIIRGEGIEECQVAISQQAQGVKGLNNEESEYSFAVVELVISVSFNPGFSSPPSILLTFEDQRLDEDIFEDCLVKPVPLTVEGDCIMWTNAQFATRVEQNSVCIHYLLHFSIADLAPISPPELRSESVRALNEFVRDIINKTAINIQAVGPVSRPKKFDK